jgi:DNA-binding SARP family transcriptional activator
MRMAYLAGDRTGALRQYERCVQALQEELGVRPGRRTEELYRMVREDALGISHLPHPGVPKGTPSNRIEQLRDLLAQLRGRINEDLDTLEHALGDAE